MTQCDSSQACKARPTFNNELMNPSHQQTTKEKSTIISIDAERAFDKSNTQL